eukprot:GHVL01025981.1.p1 GENE.GHVL01025981.1~~GHVL01025981.1.p1  ORF type:complete len:177 (+),score=19.46 GHVL01025981.1:589-1119(+)
MHTDISCYRICKRHNNTTIQFTDRREGTGISTSRCTLLSGMDRARIYCIAFSWDSHWLAVTSDKGTVHVYSLEAHETSELATSSPTNKKSRFKGISSIVKYFGSEWSFAQYTAPLGKNICCFSQKHSNQIILICSSGVMIIGSFDPVHGGEIRQEQNWQFAGVPSLECTLFKESDV